MPNRQPDQELVQAQQEVGAVRDLLAHNGLALSKPRELKVPTWRGEAAWGSVSVVSLLPGLHVFVGVITPVIAGSGEGVRILKTRFGVWVREYTGTISGKSVIAVDCAVHGSQRVWWSAAHVGKGRSGTVDDLCGRLGIERIWVRSTEIDMDRAFWEMVHITEWACDSTRLFAALGSMRPRDEHRTHENATR